MKTKKMKFKQTEVINFCDKAIIFSLYGVAFFLPISKAIIEVFIYISIAAFLLKKLLAKEDVVRSPINIPVTAYFFISFFSIFFSSNPGISSSSFLGKILQNIAFFFVVVDVLNSERRLKNIIYILFCSSLLLGIDGIFQYFTHRDFLRLRKDLMIPRIYASFGTPNDFACYLITVIPFIISLFFLKTNSRKYRLFTGGLFLLLFICLLLTVSRGAWFAFLGLILFISLWIPQLWVLIFSIAVFIAVTIVFFPPYVRDRMMNIFYFFDNSGIDRKIIWQVAWRMFSSKIWLGVGLGTFMFNFRRFLVGSYSYGVPYAHNCYLQMACEIGLIGLLSFLAILGIFFYKGIVLLNHGQKGFSWYLLLGCLAAILGYSIQIGVDTFLYSLDLGVLFWLILGIGIAAGFKINKKGQQD